MRAEHRHAHLHEGRGRNRRSDDVVRRRRHAHAEHDGRNHREEHGRQQHAARKLQQARGQLQAHTRLRDDADDDTGGRTGDEHGEYVARAVLEAAHDLDGRHARGFTQSRADDGKHDGDERCTHRRIARNEQIDNNDERQCQMTALAQDIADFRQLVTWNTFQVAALGLEMHAEPDASKIEQSRNHGRLDDVDVGHAHELCHEEGRGAHDRRHELAARGGRRLDGASEVLVIAEFLHHRDGQRTRAHNVGDGAAGDRTHEAGRQHGDLRRAAAGPARNGIGKIDKELAETRGLKVSAEENEEEDERGRDAQRNAEDTLGGKVEMADQLVEVQPTMREHTRHIGTCKGIAEEEQHDTDHRQADDTARGFDHEHDAEYAHHQVDIREPPRP